jgi:acetoin:2,6-dichlorophenolindophenol oxidoreductase subunit alpha
MSKSRQNRPTELAALYADMLVVRRSEEALIGLFADGEVPGFIHLGIGQEAVPVGVMRALGAQDTIASTHRGHGHALAKGLPLEGFFAELLGKSTGLCQGRGGSMHVADMAVGMLGANGIVGAGSSIALGSALAHKTLGRDAVAVAFFGDGALAEGLFHESLNMASLLKLPLLFACENNGWSEFSPTSSQVAFTLAKLAEAHAIPYHAVDGNDVEAVVDVAAKAVAGIRRGEGPAVIECATKRVRGHFEGDAQKYRAESELAELDSHDPLRIAAERLLTAGLDQTELDGIAAQVEARIAAAVAAARKAPPAEFAAASRDVYTQVVAA